MGILENLTNKFIKDNIKEYTSINESFDWVKKEDKLPLGGKFKPKDLENGKVLYEPNEGKITFTMSFDELIDSLNELKQEVFNINIQKLAGQFEDTSQISKKKKDIARVKTMISKHKNEVSNA